MAITDAQSGGFVYDGATGVKAVTLAGTVVVGDVVGNSSGIKRALATVGTAIQGIGIAMADGVSGEVIPVCFGQCVVGGRYSGGAGAGTKIYSAEGTDNGKVTETAPTTTGDCNKIIGVELSATEVMFDCNANADTVV